MLPQQVWQALLLLIISVPVWADANSVTLQFQVINGFPVKYVSIDMRDPDVVVSAALATKFPNGLESWDSFLTRLQPDAAINGTYFCPNSSLPVGDIAIEGELVYQGSVGTALCISPDNRVVMSPGPRQGATDWSGNRMVICAGPRLLTDGQITLNARQEGFRDPRVLGSAPRSAAAWCANGRLLFLTIERNISLTNLAYVCQRLGAVDAMTLDGGSSSGLYANGRSVTRPGRSISNILVVYTSKQQYTRHTAQLAPTGVASIATLLPTVPRPRTTSAGAMVAFTPPISVFTEYKPMPRTGPSARNPLEDPIVMTPIATTMPPIRTIAKLPYFIESTPLDGVEVQPIATPLEPATDLLPKSDGLQVIQATPPAKPLGGAPTDAIGETPMAIRVPLPDPQEPDNRLPPTVIVPSPAPPLPTPAPLLPSPPPSMPPPSLVRFMQPDASRALFGSVTILVAAADDPRISWLSLSINGQSRMFTNQQSITYPWDTTGDNDGVYTVEVSALDQNRQVLGRDIRQFSIRNATRMPR